MEVAEHVHERDGLTDAYFLSRVSDSDASDIATFS